MADVIGVLAALGFGGGECLAARLALDQPAEQVGAGCPPGMDALRCTGAKQPGHLTELALRDEGGKRLLNPDRRRAVLGVESPDHGSGVSLVVEHRVDGALEPLFLLWAGDALSVEGLGDVQGTLALEGHVEDALDHSVCGRVWLQLRTLLGPVLDVDLPIAEGGLRTQEEASRCGLPHPPGNLLRKIFRVKLVHALDDGLHELACG